MGRKPISEERKSDRPLRIRLTNGERDMIDREAEKVGKSTSTWVRETILAIACPPKKAKPKKGG